MRYRVPAQVAFIDGAVFGEGEVLYLTMLPSGKTVLLRDMARSIWLVAADCREVVPEIEKLLGQPPSAIASHVAGFLSELLARGLLEESGPR